MRQWGLLLPMVGRTPPRLRYSKPTSREQPARNPVE